MSVNNAFSQITSVIPLESRVRVLLSEEFSYSKQVGERTVSFGESLVYTGVLKKRDIDRFSLSIPQITQPVIVPYSAVEKVELYFGKRHYAKQGVLVGLFLGAFAGILGDGYGSPSFDGTPRSARSILAGVAFGLVGSAVGGFLGRIISREIWEEIPLEHFRKNQNQQSGVVSLGFIIPLKR